MWGAHAGMGWWMLFGSIWMVLFWVAVAWLVTTVISRPADSGKTESRSQTPLEIAERRLALGEISREEFERIKQALGPSGLPPSRMAS